MTTTTKKTKSQLKSQFKTVGSAQRTKNGKNIMLLLEDGTKLLITTPSSTKQQQYANAISNNYYGTHIVQEIIDNKDLQPQHINEKQPKK